MAQATIKITPDQGAVIRQFVLDVSAGSGRRLSIGAVLSLACEYGREHLTEIIERAREAS